MLPSFEEYCILSYTVLLDDYTLLCPAVQRSNTKRLFTLCRITSRHLSNCAVLTVDSLLFHCTVQTV
jgi:hypothetical protein